MINFLYSIYRRYPLLRLLKTKLRLPTPIISSTIFWSDKYKICFKFYAPIPTALKARRRGIESTILRTALHLFNYDVKHASSKTIIDIGANWGFLTLVFAKTLAFPNGKVFSFEPHPTIFKYLSLAVKKNNLNKIISPFQLVVGNKTSDIILNIFPTTSNALGNSIKKIKIGQITLDDFFINERTIDLIKIDVDGYELAVLEGAREIIKKHRPICIVETNGEKQIIQYFNDLNYLIYDVNLNRDYSNIPENIICLPHKYE